MEKIYKTMKAAGIINLILGIVTVVIGAGIGTAVMVNGIVLLKKKKKLLF